MLSKILSVESNFLINSKQSQKLKYLHCHETTEVITILKKFHQHKTYSKSKHIKSLLQILNLGQLGCLFHCNFCVLFINMKTSFMHVINSRLNLPIFLFIKLVIIISCCVCQRHYASKMVRQGSFRLKNSI